METLLGAERLWGLFASLDLQQHWQRYSNDIKLALPGKEMPSWFHNQMVEDMVMYRWKSYVSFTADIPDYCLSSEWWGIAVCLVLQADIVFAPSVDQYRRWKIGWRCRGSQYYSVDQEADIEYGMNEQYNSIDQLHIFYIPSRLFSTKRLELEFCVQKWAGVAVNWEIKRCGWRVLCKEDGEGSSNNQQEKENYNKFLELEDLIIYHCPRLQSLPKLPPNVRTTYASDCASMEPLSNTQLLWDLIASLDLQEWWHKNPFKLTLIGKKIRSWFHNQNYSFGREMGPSVLMSSAVSVIADIPCFSSESNTGIVVCLVLHANIVPAASFGEPWINWKYYTYRDLETWEKGLFWGCRPIHEQYNSTYQVHIFYISDYFLCGKKLKVDFSIELEQIPGVHNQNMPVNWGIKRCWWRVLCPEDIEAYRQTRSESYSSNIELASLHLNGFNEVRITEEDGTKSYAKHDERDKGNCNKFFEMMNCLRSWRWEAISKNYIIALIIFIFFIFLVILSASRNFS